MSEEIYRDVKYHKKVSATNFERAIVSKETLKIIYLRCLACKRNI